MKQKPIKQKDADIKTKQSAIFALIATLSGAQGQCPFLGNLEVKCYYNCPLNVENFTGHNKTLEKEINATSFNTPCTLLHAEYNDEPAKAKEIKALCAKLTIKMIKELDESSGRS